MLRLLRYAAMLGMTVITHAEDAGITGDAVATAGEMATRLGLPSAPSQAEAVAVARDIALAEMAGAAALPPDHDQGGARPDPHGQGGVCASRRASPRRISCCPTRRWPISAPSAACRLPASGG
jgi:hypothetical protein